MRNFQKLKSAIQSYAKRLGRLPLTLLKIVVLTVSALVALSLLTACAASTRFVSPMIPASISEPCPPLPLLKQGATIDDLEEDAATVSDMYETCRNKLSWFR